jgi:hypothetical protein
MDENILKNYINEMENIILNSRLNTDVIINNNKKKYSFILDVEGLNNINRVVSIIVSSYRDKDGNIKTSFMKRDSDNVNKFYERKLSLIKLIINLNNNKKINLNNFQQNIQINIENDQSMNKLTILNQIENSNKQKKNHSRYQIQYSNELHDILYFFQIAGYQNKVTKVNFLFY